MNPRGAAARCRLPNLECGARAGGTLSAPAGWISAGWIRQPRINPGYQLFSRIRLRAVTLRTCGQVRTSTDALISASKGRQVRTRRFGCV